MVVANENTNRELASPALDIRDLAENRVYVKWQT